MAQAGPLKYTAQLQFAIAADAASEDHYIGIPLDGTYRLVQFQWLPRVAVTANDTNYASIRPYNGATAVGSAITTQVTGGSSWVAGTPIQGTVTTSAGTSLEFSKTAPLKVTADASAGSGQAINGVICAQFELVRS